MNVMARSICLLAVVGAVSTGCSRSDQQPRAVAAPPEVAAPKPHVGPVDPASVERVPPQAVRERVQAGGALLVCAYPDEKCATVQLEGAIPVSQLEARLPGLPKDQEIILYCA